MLDLRLFVSRMFRSANLITLCSAAGFLGALFVYPLMLQTAFGYGPLEAGLLTCPEAIGILIGTQIASRLYSPIGPRRLIAGGQAMVCAVLVAIALVMSQTTPHAVAVLLMTLLGYGQSHTFMPIQAAAFDTVPRSKVGAGTALYNATRQAGSAVGVAVAATVIGLIGVQADPASAALPFRWALLVLAALLRCWAVCSRCSPCTTRTPRRAADWRRSGERDCAPDAVHERLRYMTVDVRYER